MLKIPENALNAGPVQPDYAKELDQEQCRVVMEGDGTALVVAGPGSGKTRTLIYRIARLLETGEKPENILLLTFTNKAAREMKERARRIIGQEAERITAGTFHHFANLLLRKHGKATGTHGFTILDEQDSREVLRQIFLDKGNKPKKGEIAYIKSVISLSKLRMVPLTEAAGEDRKKSALLESIASVYEKRKREMNSLDFDDLLLHANELLSRDAGIRENCSRRFTSILVDEFQDTDRLQASMLGKLYRKGNNLMVVGDDSQSIYSFRGAEIKNILGFRERYDARMYCLIRNYRSTAPIVALINNCMKKSREKLDKKLIAVTKERGREPCLLHAEDRSEEARVVAGMIAKELEQGRNAGVLFRAAYLASELEVELSRRGIAYEMRGGIKFFEQRHIKDMMSLLKVHENPRDSSGVMRLFALFPWIGETRIMQAIKNIASRGDAIRQLGKLERKGSRFSSMLAGIFNKGKNAAGMLDAFHEGFYRSYMKEKFPDDYKERMADIEALMSAATRYPTVSEFLASVSVDAERQDKQESGLVLSTIHQAKGLEWDSVFIIGLAEGMLPLGRSENMEEERRLFYVAASRAKSRLVMSYPLASGRFYKMEELEPSRFIRELPADCYTRGSDARAEYPDGTGKVWQTAWEIRGACRHCGEKR